MRDFDCHMICVMHTPYGPMRNFVDEMTAREAQPGTLSLSLAHGFSWGDHPRVGARTLAITGADPALAKRIARELGENPFSMRRRIMRPYSDVADALDRALGSSAGPSFWPTSRTAKLSFCSREEFWR